MGRIEVCHWANTFHKEVTNYPSFSWKVTMLYCWLFSFEKVKECHQVIKLKAEKKFPQCQQYFFIMKITKNSYLFSLIFLQKRFELQYTPFPTIIKTVFAKRNTFLFYQKWTLYLIFSEKTLPHVPNTQCITLLSVEGTTVS